jgi:radical SAM superfamily enzyme YgiQ (UPF0313 family)
VTQTLKVPEEKLGGEEAFQEFVQSLKIPCPREILLVQVPSVPEEHYDLVTARNRGYYNYPPVGLLYLAAVAKEVDPRIDVRILDLNFEINRRSHSDSFRYQIWQDLLSQALESCEAPHAGISCMFGTNKSTFLEIARFIRGNFPKVPVLAGGVQASYDFRELLTGGYCDIVFRKEGELQFKAFLESCLAGKAAAVPRGAAFRFNDEVHEIRAPEGDVPLQWDIRPFYSLIPIQDYYRYGSLGAFSRYNDPEKRFATVLSNRGCRARCTFCTVRDFNGFGIRQRSVEDVVEEIKFLVRQMGVQQIDWLDDDLLWDPARTVELFKRLAQEIPGLEWSSSNGLIAVAISEEIMRWMVESGMKAFKIGIESGNDEMLRLIKKPTSKQSLREKRKLFAKYPQVFVGANFIIGFPHEPFGKMMDSFNFANELAWDWVTYNICQPLKGTEMFSAFQELGDDRCYEESYDKSLMPGRAASKGEVGARSEKESAPVLSGRDVFKLPYDLIPSKEQLREIWFTFNMVTNFVNNFNFTAAGNPRKIIRWFEAIHSGYPHDASMCAALARGYKILGEKDLFLSYRKKFESLVASSPYWQRRVKEFPELAEFTEVGGLKNSPLPEDAAYSMRNWSGGAI